MRTESKAMKFIKVQCNILDLNPKALYEQSKLCCFSISM